MLPWLAPFAPLLAVSVAGASRSVPVPLVDQAPPAVGAPAALAYETPEGMCLLVARTTVTGLDDGAARVEVGAHDAAIASWARRERKLHLVGSGAALAPCTGLPPVHPIEVPPEGRAIGLLHPAAAIDHDRVREVTPIGGPDWLVVYPTPSCRQPCWGEVAVSHDDLPPTLFAVRLGADAGEAALSPDATVVRLPAGGATRLELGPQATWLLPASGVELVPLDDAVLLLAKGRAQAHGFLRVGQAPPTPLRVQATGTWGPPQGEPEVTVPAGRTRSFRLDQVPDHLWVADDDVAAAEVRGRRLRVEGRHPGHTHVALDLGGGQITLLRVAVGR